MNAFEQPNGRVVLEVTRDELRILSNSLGVTLEKLHNDDAEYSTRVGATSEEGRALKREFRELSMRLPRVE
ncbi:hypothetical protein [Aeromicrobium sp. 9AM]|uniref:hypothetical protein n=1 Tax=Aeromicrobium sp. 9AM TaxID=2653126 RepID=UPI00135CDD15|nr:hypothetical protein [Aeromicrobium sp. 9AM]